MSDRSPGVDSEIAKLGNEYHEHQQRIENFKTDKTDVVQPSSDEDNNPVRGYFQQKHRIKAGTKFALQAIAADPTLKENRAQLGRIQAEKISDPHEAEYIESAAEEEYQSREELQQAQDELKKRDRDSLIPEALIRSKFTDEVDRTIKRTENAREHGRTVEPASLVFEDLDRFKIINDTFGHGFGDILLRIAGRSQKLRYTDVLGRLGGEELAALLNNTDPLQAIWAAERIQQNLHFLLDPNGDKSGIEDILPKDFEFPEGFNPFQTISFGIAAYKQGQTSKEFIASGDAAMYAAKKVRHQEQELDIEAENDTGKIAINDGESLYVINTHNKLKAQRLRDLDLTDPDQLKDWLSISLGTTPMQSHFLNFDSYLADIKAREGDIIAAVKFMINTATPVETIRKQLARYVRIPSDLLEKDHRKPVKTEENSETIPPSGQPAVPEG